MTSAGFHLARLLPAVLLAAAVPLGAQTGGSAPSAEYPLAAPDVYLISEPSGNMLVMVGREGSLVVGAQAPSRVARTRALLASLNAPPVRYALVTAGDSILQRGDGGWEETGAISVAHERLRNVIRRAPRSDSAVNGHMPSLGYSEVFQLAINDDEIHAVYQAPGYSDADVSIHFEERRFLYLGNMFTTDGYPSINAARGGTLAGLIANANKFLDLFGEDPRMVEPIVPGRGPLAKIGDLYAYRDMLVEARAQIEPLVREGKTIEEVVAARPTAALDERWGHGAVSPAQFVTMAYRSLERELKKK